MRANKIFFDTYYPHPDADDVAIVHIVLRDAGVYTTATRKQVFDLNLWRGCFLEDVCDITQERSTQHALDFVKSIGARYVPLEEFQAIEAERETQRVAMAFAMAERMIREG